MRGRNGVATARGALVDCRSVRRPLRFSGLGLVSVVTVDLERGLDPIDTDAILSDGRTVYASPTSLYVATERWDARPDGSRPLPETSTAIHRFDIASPTQTHYRGSGTVAGVLLNQWSLSERDGVLRVASTEQPLWWGGPRTESETAVTTLGARGGALVQLGRVGGLGKGERVYAVRFVGDIGYVVTFRQIDPLYTLDLSAPSRPVVRGELKIRGYSAYLHPVGDDLLLGIGQDATDEGQVLGAQASLFDVSDLRRPRRLDAFSLGKAWSEAEHDHRAFLWWPRTRLAAIPVGAAGEGAFSGLLGLRVGRTGITETGRVSHPGQETGGAGIRRSVVVGETLYTVSEARREGLVARLVRRPRLRPLLLGPSLRAACCRSRAAAAAPATCTAPGSCRAGGGAASCRAGSDGPAPCRSAPRRRARAGLPPPRARRRPSGSAPRSVARARCARAGATSSASSSWRAGATAAEPT